MFVPKMWFDEVERIGMQRCTPFGYALKAVGEVVGFAGLLLLVAMPVYLMQQAIVGAFSWPLLWLLAGPAVHRWLHRLRDRLVLVVGRISQAVSLRLRESRIELDRSRRETDIRIQRLATRDQRCRLIPRAQVSTV